MPDIHRTELRPFLPEDFDDACEDCPAPAGAYCFDDCPSGYTAEDAREEASRAPHDPRRSARRLQECAVTTYTHSEIEAALTAGIEMTAEVAEQNTTDHVFSRVRAGTLARIARIAWPSDGPLTGEAVPNDAYGFTFEQVSRAVNGAVDAAAGNHCPNDRDNLLANTVLTLVKDPNASFDDIAGSCYSEDPDTIAEWVRDAI
ncbi:hypothetical protein [Embleya sp. MST-111070]|uniref:hypothetical protein n=1 Tax=Embleya sp. MST-111070 TaxID=3398231 RepID=UPI003F737907